VVIVRAAHDDEMRGRVCADQVEKVGQTRAAKASNHVPAFDADMARVLPGSRQGLDLRQSVFARLPYCAADGQRPVLEDHARVVDVIAVEGKLLRGVRSESAKVFARCPE